MPIAVSLKLPVACTTARVTRRVVPYDRRALKDLEQAAKFMYLLQWCPTVPFNVEASTHQFVLSEYIREALVASFPKGPPPPKTCDISRRPNRNLGPPQGATRRGTPPPIRPPADPARPRVQDFAPMSTIPRSTRSELAHPENRGKHRRRDVRPPLQGSLAQAWAVPDGGDHS